MYYSLDVFGMWVLVALSILLFWFVLSAHDNYKRDVRRVASYRDGKAKFEYKNIVITILIGLFVLLMSIIKIDSNDKKIVKLFHYDYIQQIGYDRHRLIIMKKDYLGADYIKMFTLGGYDKIEGVENSPEGNLYIRKCSYSEHWLGLWEGYNEECIEYIHRE